MKTVLVLMLTVLTLNVSAQSKVEKANNELLIENKAPLLDGKHQTKAWFSTSNDLNSTKDKVSKFTLDDINELYRFNFEMR